MVWTCSTRGLEEKNECNCSRRNTQKDSFQRPGHKRENDVDMALKSNVKMWSLLTCKFCAFAVTRILG